MVIHPSDNVEVRADGHKYALRPIAKGENVIKYGMPVGHATADIAAGEHVHTHNLATNLGEKVEYRYAPRAAAVRKFEHSERPDDMTFSAYRRPDGRIGIRNEIWIVPTVGCVNALCERLAKACDGIALTHPYGCSQLGEDHETTANLLAALCRHPNAGGVLVVGLGCENNTLDSFKARLGDVTNLNIRFLRAQDPGDEYEAGLGLIRELEAGRVAERTEVSVS
jgi:altronate hydrolase